VVLKIALDEVMADSSTSNAVLKKICRKLRVSEQSVNSIVKEIIKAL